jgi:hypothetical protein
VAIKATFSPGAGLLSVFDDNLDNSIVASRDPAGNILINGGAVAVTGGQPTVANTAMIQVFGTGGNRSTKPTVRCLPCSCSVAPATTR